MFDQSFEKQERRIRELEAENAAIDREIAKLLEELNVSAKQVQVYVNDPDHFSEEQWQILQQQRKDLNERLSKKLAEPQNPRDVKNRYAERNVPSHWMPVR